MPNKTFINSFFSLSLHSQINEGCKQTHFTKKNEKINKKNSNNEKSISRPFNGSDKKNTHSNSSRITIESQIEMHIKMHFDYGKMRDLCMSRGPHIACDS